MLLPSAFPLDVFHQPQSSASSSMTPSPSGPRGAFISLSSCRALQAILGIRPAASPLTSIFPNTLSCQRRDEKEAIPSRSEKSPPQRAQRAPLSLLKPNIKPPPRLTSQTRSQATRPVPEPGRTNKRNRADFESTDEDILVSTTNGGTPASDHFSGHPHHRRPSPTSTNAVMSTADGDGFSTPKRQRRVPLLIPLGLSAEDFEGLDPTPKAQSQTLNELPWEESDFPFATGTAGDEACEPGWSAASDRMLVSSVLDKLNLSRKNWNDCAMRMGKEGDSLGKRWGVLVRDGDVALRRGSGGRSKPQLKEVFLDG